MKMEDFAKMELDVPSPMEKKLLELMAKDLYQCKIHMDISHNQDSKSHNKCQCNQCSLFKTKEVKPCS